MPSDDLYEEFDHVQRSNAPVAEPFTMIADKI